MILEFHALDFGQFALEQLLAARDLLAFELRRPLEGREVLRHEHRGAHRDAQARGTLLLGKREIAGANQRGQAGDAKYVFVRLRGQADHKIEFDRRPALLEGVRHGAYQIFFGDAFVDDVPQALRPRLWG